MARILVVDDDPVGRERLRRAFAPGHHDVVEVASAEQALEAHRARSADAVVVNLFMPQKEGLDAVRLLRERGASVPILGLAPPPSDDSAAAQETTRATHARDLQKLALEAGATHLVDAPPEPDALRRVITTLLGW